MHRLERTYPRTTALKPAFVKKSLLAFTFTHRAALSFRKFVVLFAARQETDFTVENLGAVSKFFSNTRASITPCVIWFDRFVNGGTLGVELAHVSALFGAT